jgi:hypothetical protein
MDDERWFAFYVPKFVTIWKNRVQSREWPRSVLAAHTETHTTQDTSWGKVEWIVTNLPKICTNQLSMIANAHSSIPAM